MKWRKHSSTERNQIQSKLVRKHFGAEGYGIYQALKEVIAENVEAGNFEEWGSVNVLHDVETLADECMTTPDKLRDFLQFCNQKKIFEKKEGKLYCEQMLNELDDYAERLRNNFKQFKDKVKLKEEKVSTKTEQKQDTVELSSPRREREEKKIRLEEKREEDKPQKSLSYLMNIPLPDLEEFSKAYSCSQRQGKSKGEDLFNYCKAKGKKYSDYKALLRNAIKKDFGERIPTITFESPDLNYKPISKEKMEEFRKQRNLLAGKKSLN